MIVIDNVKKPDGTLGKVTLSGSTAQYIDGTGLLLLPAAIDPHVHFRVPGAEHKENWISGARAAIHGGVTTVIDMPNNTPSCTSFLALIEKHNQIERQLENAGIPLRYFLYFGADKRHINELKKVKGHSIGIKIFMGSSTGDLLIDDDATLETIFKIAADQDMLVSVHAEDEGTIQKNKDLAGDLSCPSVHSKIRCHSAAEIAVKKAIDLAHKHKTRLCILHISTKEELALIKQAKKSGLQVYAEVSPHHLLLSTDDYASFGTRVKVNPPLRDKENHAFLWAALKDGTIDFVGTDHAPHTAEEKAQHYTKAPSGVPGVEFLLPLLLDAVNKGKIDLTTLTNITRRNIEKIFRLPPQEDVVLVDMHETRQIHNHALQSKCGWSPYAGRQLTGWPKYTIVQGKVFHLGKNHAV